jgi:uncharacterized protein YkwD
MSNARGLFRRCLPSHTCGPNSLWARRGPQVRMAIRKTALTVVLTIAVVTPLRARLEQPGDAGGQQGGQKAQTASALVQMKGATAKQADVVTLLRRQQEQEAALRRAQEEAARQALALAAQQQAEALAAQQAQLAAQQAAEAAAAQQRQVQEAAAAAAARRAQEAAQRQAEAAQRKAEAAAGAEAGFIQPAADTLTPLERSIFNTVNQQRASAGLGPLRIDYTLVAAARSHSARMSAGNRLFHSSNLAAAAPSAWRKLGENVAMSTSVDTMNSRLMESPIHRDNILGNFDHIGVGAVVVGNKIWVTQEFMATS